MQETKGGPHGPPFSYGEAPLAEDLPQGPQSEKDTGQIELPAYEGLLEYQAQLTAKEDPGFDKAGKVHDWRNHVGEQCRKLWPEFSITTRLAIAADAQAAANAEEWE